MKPITGLSQLYPKPERLPWRDKAASNALGLVGLVLFLIFGCGLYAIFTWARGLL
jgi:hypothetical protein